MLPLLTADLLTHAIVGSVLENLDMERLVREVGQAVSQRILGNNESVDDVAQELHERLLLRNESTKKVVIESIYRESEEAKHNVNVYMSAASLVDARPLLRRVSQVFDTFSLQCLNNLQKGTRYTLHGEIPALASDSIALIIPLHALSSRSPLRKLDRPRTQLHQSLIAAAFCRSLAPAQGRHGLRGVWRAGHGECLWNCRRLDAVLARWGQGGLRRDAERTGHA